jgi:transglutaminase-like putative cysteine protease/uncharacterized alpha-E superfamily protein
LTTTALPAHRLEQPLLARIADALYWLGRYLARAEGTVRVVQAYHDALFDLPVGAELGWTVLLRLSGTEELFRDRYQPLLGGEQLPDAGPGEDQVLPFCLLDLSNPSALRSSLRAVRANARTAAALLPMEVAAAVHDLWQIAQDGPVAVPDRARRLAWLGDLLVATAAVGRVAEETLGRDQPGVFLGLGRALERADLTCRVLEAWAPALERTADPFAAIHRATVLRALHAEAAFRRGGWRLQDPLAVPLFVLLEEAFPGSVRSELGTCLTLLEALPFPCRATAALLQAGTVLDDAVSTAEALLPSVVAPAVRTALTGVHGQLTQLWELPASPSGTSATASRPRARRVPVGPRRLRVLHRSRYRYEEPASASTTEAHLRPRATPRQRLVAHQLTIDPPPATTTPLLDPFGNHLVVFSVDEPHRTLEVSASSTVELLPSAPPASSPPWETVRHLLQLDRHAAVLEARRFVPGSRKAPASPTLAAYAAESFPPDRPLHEAALDLACRIREDFAYLPGSTTVSTPVEEVFDARRGVCQDFAHLAVACLRSLGLAARYVSGYLLPTAGTPVDPRAQASHAWFAVFVPGAGWLDLDPTNEPLVSDHHVTLAWGRDYDDVAPLRGTVRGGGTQRLEVEVLVELVDD